MKHTDGADKKLCRSKNCYSFHKFLNAYHFHILLLQYEIHQVLSLLEGTSDTATQQQTMEEV
jgi:hypothetical protein